MSFVGLTTPDALRSHIGPGERLLWSGRPRQGFVLRASDAFMIPFSIMWGGFAVVWQLAVVLGGAPFFFVIWGIPFVLMGLYITVGRFFVDARIRSRTHYGLTDQRVIVSKGRPGSTTVTTLPLQTLQTISLKSRRNGSGTVSFGSGNVMAAMYSGFHFPGMSSFVPTQFELIDDAAGVHQKILAARQETLR